MSDNSPLPPLLQNSLVFAARYTHHRQTAGAHSVCAALSLYWPRLDAPTQDQIIRESLQATCNVEDWARFRGDHAPPKRAAGGDIARRMNVVLNDLRLIRDRLDPIHNDSYEEITDAIECVKAAAVWASVSPTGEDGTPRVIHKFNGGRGATICTSCKVIICEGFTSDLFCEDCGPESGTP